MEPCPTEEIVQAFVEDRLRPPDRATLEAHLGGCGECGALVAAVTKSWFEEGSEKRGPGAPDFAVGQRVGPYSIAAFAGRGGMGEVYRAHDPRLDRDVAIKTLPARFAEDPERLARFQVEARATGKIAHPNALTVFDVGTHEGIPYLVTEWLTGTTLKERLARGKMSLPQICRMGAGLAHALAAAHDKGVIHRDLKPDNVFCCADGTCKILDFGVARLVASLEEPLSGAHTQPGALVGTVGYMSPEQIRGEEIDPRADVFALGAVLYEMVSGEPAFGNKGPIERMTATLRDEPPPCGGELGAVIARCLAKDPAKRFQSAHDLAFHLEAMAIHDAPPAAPSVPRRWGTTVLALCAAAGIAGFVGYHSGARAHPLPSRPVYRPLTFSRGEILSARYSSDGHTVFYGASWDGGPAQLYSVRTDSVGSEPLGIGAAVRAVSPRGELAMLLEPQAYENGNPSGTLARMGLGGSAPRAVLEDVYEADWGPGGEQLAAVSKTGLMYRLEYPIGTVRYQGESWLSHIRVSPRGDTIALLLHRDPKDDMGSVAVLEPNGTIRELSSGWSSIRGLAWAKGGTEIWFTARGQSETHDLYAVDMSGKVRLIDRVAGRMLLQDISPAGKALIDLQDHRTALYVGNDAGERDWTWSDGCYLTGLSSDGRTMVFAGESVREGPDYGAYMRTTDGAPPIRLGDGVPAALSPDGRWVILRRHGPPLTLSLVPTGAGTARPIPNVLLTTLFDIRLFPDGRRALLRGIEGPGHLPRMWIHDLGDAPPRPVTPEGVAPMSAVSPKGDRFAGLDSEGNVRLFGIDGQDLGTLPNRFPNHTALGFDADGSGLYLRTRELPVQISRLDLGSGTLTPHVVVPRGGRRSGLVAIMTLFLSADGKTWAYSSNETLSQLYEIEGLPDLAPTR